MRLVFYCPLTARIGHHLREFVRFKSHNAYRKYHYFISSYFNNPGREVAIFWDGQKKPDWYGYSKCFFWMLINGIKPWKVKILEKVRDLDPKNDVVMGFPFLSFNNWSLCDNSLFFTYPGLKVFHFSHYFAETEKVCSLIKNCSNTVIIADSNIQKNPL